MSCSEKNVNAIAIPQMMTRSTTKPPRVAAENVATTNAISPLLLPLTRSPKSRRAFSCSSRLRGTTTPTAMRQKKTKRGAQKLKNRVWESSGSARIRREIFWSSSAEGKAFFQASFSVEKSRCFVCLDIHDSDEAGSSCA